MRDEPPVEAACPHGQVMPVAQAQACNARIGEINDEFAAIKARHDNLVARKNQIAAEEARKNADLEAQKNQIALDEANKISALESKKTAATALQANIEACSNDPSTMSKKACLDHIFDNQSEAAAAYDLDPSVVKPDYLGGHKSTVNIVRTQNKVHDDTQIRKITSKKITVPSPTSTSTTATPK
jgi:hypothetical protein